MRTRRSRIVDVIVVVVVVSTILKNEPDLLNLEDKVFFVLLLFSSEKNHRVAFTELSDDFYPILFALQRV